MKSISKMIVGIDVSQVIYGTGSSTYTKNLVTNLLRSDPDVQYKLFAGSLRRKSQLQDFFGTLKGNVVSKSTFISPSIADLLWNQIHFINIENFLGQLDVFHSSDWTQPPSKAKKVTTIHDMSPILYPEFTQPKIVDVHKRRLALVKREVDIIIVPSNSTKSDVINYGIEKEKIKVIPEAVEKEFKSVKKEEILSIKLKFGITKNYLLTVGANVRKNIESTVKAFVKITSDIPLQLVIVGRPQNMGIKLSADVIFTGHVTDQELIGLYSGAQALVYPSFYEGFGLPVLEAFACSCPVVCSNTSSLPELAGDSAVLVDPYSQDSIKNGILKILKNRQKYIKKGKKRIKDYSWEKTATETLKIYKNLHKLI